MSVRPVFRMQLTGIEISKSWLLIFTLFFFISGCDSKTDSAPPLPSAPVHVAPVEKGTTNRSISAVGNVVPSVTVAITPRVDGEILDILFKEGDQVVEGQPLIQIDPRPYAAILAEKQALLAKSQAQLSKARRDQARYGKLVSNGYISKEAFEQTATDTAALSATVQADKAAVDRAALDLSYCDISAPISGRIGELKLHKGNMVKNNDSGAIATIDTISPCYVTFSIPEIHLPIIMAQMQNNQLPVTAVPVGGKPSPGIMTLVDNRVDTKTGSIRLRGTFPNEPQQLWPGQFVEVQLPLGERMDAMLIPTRAIQRGQNETYLYIVNGEGKATYRKITPLFEYGAQTAIEGDVKPGDLVVTEGQVRLAPGVPVQILDNEKPETKAN